MNLIPKPLRCAVLFENPDPHFRVTNTPWFRESHTKTMQRPQYSKQPKEVQSKKLLSHHVHNALIQLRFADLSHLQAMRIHETTSRQNAPTGMKQPHSFGRRQPQIEKSTWNFDRCCCCTSSGAEGVCLPHCSPGSSSCKRPAT